MKAVSRARVIVSQQSDRWAMQGSRGHRWSSCGCDGHVAVLCLQQGRPVQSKCIVHTSLYYPVAAVLSRECDRLFKFDEFVMLETHLSSCV